MTGVTMAEAGPQAGASNGALGDTWWWTEVPLDVCGKSEGLTEEDRTVWVDFKCQDAGGNKAKTTVGIEWKLTEVGEGDHLIQQGQKMIISGPKDTCEIGGEKIQNVYVQVYSAHDDELIVYEPYDAAHADEANVVYTFEDEGPDQIFQAGFACQDVKTGEPIADTHATTTMHVIKKLKVKVVLGWKADSFPSGLIEWLEFLSEAVWSGWSGSCNADYLLMEVPRSDAYSSWVDEYQLVGGRKADLPWFVKPFLDADVAWWSKRQEPGCNKLSVKVTHDGCALAHDTGISIHINVDWDRDGTVDGEAGKDTGAADGHEENTRVYICLNNNFDEREEAKKDETTVPRWIPDNKTPGMLPDDPQLCKGRLSVDSGGVGGKVVWSESGVLMFTHQVRIWRRFGQEWRLWKEGSPLADPDGQFSISLLIEGVKMGKGTLTFTFKPDHGDDASDAIKFHVVTTKITQTDADIMLRQLMVILRIDIQGEPACYLSLMAKVPGDRPFNTWQNCAKQWAILQMQSKLLNVKTIAVRTLKDVAVKGLTKIVAASGPLGAAVAMVAGVASDALGPGGLVGLARAGKLKVASGSTRDEKEELMGVDTCVVFLLESTVPGERREGRFAMGSGAGLRGNTSPQNSRDRTAGTTTSNMGKGRSPGSSSSRASSIGMRSRDGCLTLMRARRLIKLKSMRLKTLRRSRAVHDFGP